jgi:hypothetical protein
MPKTGRPTVRVELADDEREALTRLARRAKSSQALALRSKIVLASAEPDAATLHPSEPPGPGTGSTILD